MSEYFKPNNDIDLNKLYPLAKTIEGVPYYPFKSSFTIPDLKETITSYGSGFYFDPQFSEKFGIENFNLQSTHFTERPDWRVGREESYHGVTFGELELTINQGNDEEEIVVPIAIKPFFSNDKNEAIHEYLALKLINQYPTMQTFKPIGLFVNESNRTFLLTLFEEEVLSLDNVDWQLGTYDKLDRHFAPFKAISSSAKILALLHSQGFVHQDTQIKNMAIDRNGVRIVDLTRLRRIPLLDLSTDYESQHFILKDFLELIRSINERKYLTDTTSDKRKQIIEMNLLSPYLSIMRHPSNLFASNIGFQKTLKSILDTSLEEI